MFSLSLFVSITSTYRLQQHYVDTVRSRICVLIIITMAISRPEHISRSSHKLVCRRTSTETMKCWRPLCRCTSVHHYAGLNVTDIEATLVYCLCVIDSQHWFPDSQTRNKLVFCDWRRKNSGVWRRRTNNILQHFTHWTMQIKINSRNYVGPSHKQKLWIVRHLIFITCSCRIAVTHEWGWTSYFVLCKIVSMVFE
jgi:hypothetical protein